MSTAVATRISADEFLRNHGDESHVELVRGEVVREPMPGSEHGTVGSEVHFALMTHVKSKKLGRLLINDTFIKTGVDSFRGMDICYVSYSRYPANKKMPKGPMPVPPELVVEVLSPSNRSTDMDRKIDEYLAVGVDAVVVIDPDLEIASVFRPNELPQRFHNGDTFELPDVLPGFSAPLKSFFT